MPVGNLGVMAVMADVGGAAGGMWQPGEVRAGLVGTAGAPCHFELHTAETTPYGRLASAADANGAMFKLRADQLNGRVAAPSASP